MTNPELAVRNSGYGGRGYVLPASVGQDSKDVKGSEGQLINARLDENGNVTVVPSVTTVLKAAAKPAIEQWVADQTAAYAVANIDELLSRSEMQGYGFLRWYHKRSPLPLDEGFDPRNYYLGVLNDAAELGTKMHEWADADVDPAFKYPDVDGESSLFWEMQEAWEEYNSEHFIMSLNTECTVWNYTLGYAGTYDGLWNIDGQDWLLDIKTARSLWPEHSMQLAALSQGESYFTKSTDGYWDEKPFVLPKNVKFGFLHIRPSDMDNAGNYMEPFVRLEEAKHLDVRFEQFKGYLLAKRGELEIADREKNGN